MYKPPVKRWSDSSTSTRHNLCRAYTLWITSSRNTTSRHPEVLGSIPNEGSFLFFLVLLPPARRGRRPLSNEPLCASNGEVWGRWWTSKREGVCWCSETGKIFTDREIFTNRRSKSALLVSPSGIDRKARYQNRHATRHRLPEKRFRRSLC